MRYLVIVLLLWTAGAQAQSAGRLPPDFVYLRDIDASIQQDIRYASSNNFTGHALPGYGAAECVLRRDAARALQQVQTSLKGSGLSLKVYDCYRPQRAVNAMARWAQAREDGKTRGFYPGLDKRTLFATGWIAFHSKHSAGIAVDLTLVPASPQPPPNHPPGGCDTAQAGVESLDMGTAFDCFSAKSHTRSEAIAPEARANRARLVAAMRKHGLHNYFREWWHFSYGGGAPAVAYDVPIPPR